MTFIIDTQTYSDLNILGAENRPVPEDSVMKLFAGTETDGGRGLIRELLKSPSPDREVLSGRIEAIRYFEDKDLSLDISNTTLRAIHFYLTIGFPLIPQNPVQVLEVRLRYFFQPSSEVYNILTGIRHLIGVLKSLSGRLEDLPVEEYPSQLREAFEKAGEILNREKLHAILHSKKKHTMTRLLSFDHLFRKELKGDVDQLLELVYRIDAYQTIARVARERNFSYPEYSSQEGGTEIILKDVFHPCLEGAVANDVAFRNSGLCFLSGPNMAGKSTFLRSVGIAVYLAHVGFPVPAASMRTSVFNGLITTINLDDQLDQGYSHFYSEVKRVKEVVNHIKAQGEMVVIFDELFRGTNVKDAYDGTVMLCRQFAGLLKSKFFISTHIVEAIETLSREQQEVLFHYFDAEMAGEEFTYNYRLKEGYSAQRLGKNIIEREKIVEVIGEIKARGQEVR